MSKSSRLARPPSAGAGSKLPSPKKECPGTESAAAARARSLSVGEKLMRAGSDGFLHRQKSLTFCVSLDKEQTETKSSNHGPGEKEEDVDTVPQKTRISPSRPLSQSKFSPCGMTASDMRGGEGR